MTDNYYGEFVKSTEVPKPIEAPKPGPKRIGFGPESLKDHLERVNEAIANGGMDHDDVMRSLELVKARAMVSIADSLFSLNDNIDNLRDMFDQLNGQVSGIKARLGE